MAGHDRAIPTGTRVNNRTIPVGEWWLNIVGDLIRNDPQGRDYTQLGIDLAKRVGRTTPFDKAQISRVATKNGQITEDLIAAFCIEYPNLPWPVFIARSQPEAVVVRDALEAYWRRLSSEPEDKGQPAIVTFPHRVTRERIHGSAPVELKKKRKAAG
jgi:hypothetical protein